MRACFVAVLLAMSTPALANEKLINLAKLTILDVRLSYDKCEMLLREYHTAFQYDGDSKIRSIIGRMVDCETKAPDLIAPSVAKFRAALKSAGKSEQPFKDYMMTFRKALSMLGPETSNRQAIEIGKILAAKGEAVVAELEW